MAVEQAEHESSRICILVFTYSTDRYWWLLCIRLFCTVDLERETVTQGPHYLGREGMRQTYPRNL